MSEEEMKDQAPLEETPAGESVEAAVVEETTAEGAAEAAAPSRSPSCPGLARAKTECQPKEKAPPRRSFLSLSVFRLDREASLYYNIVSYYAKQDSVVIR